MFKKTDPAEKYMIAIIDYGVGNLFSLKSSFAAIGEEAVVTGDEKVLNSADRILLPGVGAFGDAAAKLRATGMDKAVIEQAATGKPLLGVCVGMQLLFDMDYEYGEHPGLGLIPGEVRDIGEVIDPSLKKPQIGWNALKFIKRPDGEISKLFKYIHEGDHMYVVHSYAAAKCDSFVTSTTEYSADLVASVERGNVYGTQFHPEKSGPAGLAILKAFCEL